MKNKIISALLVLLLSISISACSDKTGLNKENNSSASDTLFDSKSTQESSEKNPVIEVYKRVLQNKADFFSTDNKKNVYLNDLLTNKEIYGTIFKVTHFTVLDMDGDNIPEVVLELTVGDYVEFYEVLHYMDNKVYGYIQVLRGLLELKEDGTFSFSNGASDNGYGKLRFIPDICEADTLAYCQSSRNNPTTELYFINNISVADESYKSYGKEQAGKKGVVWYDFSPEYIEKELAINY